jgi:peroxiredoxin
MRGQVWLLNVWASWCAACQVEHPLFNDLAKAGTLPIVGLAWKDTPENSIAWLRKLGNPYAVVVSDLKGGVAIDYGVYGAPETYVIDKQGVIRFKHVGPLTRELPDEAVAAGAAVAGSEGIAPRSAQAAAAGSPRSSRWRRCWHAAVGPGATAQPARRRHCRCQRVGPQRHRQPDVASSAAISGSRECVAWCARTRPSPIRTPRWPRTCVAKSAR